MRPGRPVAVVVTLIGGCALLIPLLVPLLIFATPGAPRTAASGLGVPPRALAAYVSVDAWCPGLRWEVVAAIGQVESGHGTFGGASLDVDGHARPWIFGPPLDGAEGVERIPVGRWLGWWGLTGPWEQAVGPMQFRAPTFSASAVDADGDGQASPHDIDDAAATAASYLCGGPGGRVDDERAAVGRYNRNTAYVDDVLALANILADDAADGDGMRCPVAGRVSFADTWGAPRSGGRSHKGVDMFADHGTPVLAPVAGDVEHRADSLGGLAFHLWGEDGTYYYGAHLSAYGPSTGPVPAGAVIGYVGDTGNAIGTWPHLHFEIHPGRTRGAASAAVNPTPAVREACATPPPDAGSGR